MAPTNSGDGQTDTIGGTLPSPLRVLVLRDQAPLSGAVVSWTVNVGSVSPHTTTTDVSGIAQAIWTLGDTVGAQVATASLPADTVVNDTVPLHVSFSAIARPGAPIALVFRPGPSNAFVGRPLNPVVRVAAVDRLGNVATDFGGSVTVALGSAPSGASLTGTTPVDALDGVATFTDLILDQIGTHYSLIASAAGLPSATSAPFAILALGSGRIAFVSSRDGNSEIYVMNADGSGQVNLTNNPGYDGSPAWSPDGSRIAFSSDRDGNGEIYVMNADGSGLRNLTNNPGGDLEPAWSPDGTKIAFTSTRDGNEEIYVMNADGSGVINVTNNPGNDYAPAWSPDGTRIAFTSTRDGDFEVYVMNADGSGLRNLTNNPGGDLGPAWSPDGTKIAFRSFRGSYKGIYVMNADGSGATPLIASASSAEVVFLNLVWSPDGSKIAYELLGLSCFPRCTFGTFNVYVMTADGSGFHNLTSNLGRNRGPVWSPDGTRIAFASDRNGNNDIYVMNADGSGQINLTNNPGSDYTPAWRPR